MAATYGIEKPNSDIDEILKILTYRIYWLFTLLDECARHGSSNPHIGHESAPEAPNHWYGMRPGKGINKKHEEYRENIPGNKSKRTEEQLQQKRI